MSSKSSSAVATMGIDIGKNSFHLIGLPARPQADDNSRLWSMAFPISSPSFRPQGRLQSVIPLWGKGCNNDCLPFHSNGSRPRRAELSTA
jgi:hypothetical protein